MWKEVLHQWWASLAFKDVTLWPVKNYCFILTYFYFYYHMYYELDHMKKVIMRTFLLYMTTLYNSLMLEGQSSLFKWV